MTTKNDLCRLYVVDDDDAVRDSLRWLLEANGFQVEDFSTAESFLAQYDPNIPAILISDIRMPGMSGLELQEALNAMHAPLPILFITGHGDVPMAVSTMKLGAFDFLQKPFNEAELRDRINQIAPIAVARVHQYQLQAQINNRMDRLTSRERQVLECIIKGRLNKQIADDLDISIKTVEAHRSNIMNKLEVGSIASLMKLALNQPDDE